MPPLSRMAIKPLTDAAVRGAKPREKAYKLADGQGMYLEVMPTGAKYWRLKYRVDGQERRAALGVYPAVSLPLLEKAPGNCAPNYIKRCTNIRV